jgi:hypothetical protein
MKMTRKMTWVKSTNNKCNRKDKIINSIQTRSFLRKTFDNSKHIILSIDNILLAIIKYKLSIVFLSTFKICNKYFCNYEFKVM